MKPRNPILYLTSALLVVILILAGCGAPVETTQPAAGGDSGEAAAPATDSQSGAMGAILTDAPADAGERPVQMQVFNTPAEAEAATGQAISTYGEAPELAERVAAGELPPVEERLPANPIVVQPEEAVGKYGGTLRKTITGQVPRDEVGNWWVAESLTVHSPQGDIIPNVAESWEWSDDYKVLTLNIRQGIRWSDGEPFTANDIRFWWEDVVLNTELTPAPPTLLTRGGELAQFTMVDDYTIQISFSEPYALFTTYLGSWGFPRSLPTQHPRHYLEQFHPNYADMESIEAAMEEDGFDSWADFFNEKVTTTNPDRPTIGAWIPTAAPPNPVEVFVRNPSYWKVDTAGNQLPYIGEIRSTRVADVEAALLKTIAGELDFVRALGQSNLPILSDNKEGGDYRFAYADWMPNAYGNIMFNFTTSDPVKNELYNNKQVRQALSVAIDRDEIVKLIYKGGVFASQIAPLRGEPYYGESDLFQSWAQFDPDLANQMLDEIGLTERDTNGFRLGPDGNELLLNIAATTAWPPETAELMELVKGYWEEVGIRATVTPEAGELWSTRHNAGEHDVAARGAHFGGGPVHPTLNSNTFALAGWQWAPDWALWMDTNGEQGVEPPSEVKRLREIREQILAEPSEEVRNALKQEVFEIHMDNLWSIGLVVDDPRFGQLAVVHNRLRNVVTHSISGEWYPTVPQQWFINE